MIVVIKKVASQSYESDFFHGCFEAIEEGKTSGKVSLYVNPYHIIEGENILTIGNFECVNDQDVFRALMGAVKEEATQLNVNRIIGPMNGSTWNEYRLLSTSNAPPFLLDVDTPLYYIDLFTDYGFTILAEYSSTRAEEIVVNWDKVSPTYDRFVDMGVYFEGFNVDQADEEFRRLSILCNEAFKDNFLFSPISAENFITKMKATLPLINPRYTLLAKKDDQTVGFIFTYPNKLDILEETVVVKTLARDPSDQYQGLGSVLSSLSMKSVQEDGFTKGIHALMVNSNSSTYISSKFKANIMRSYALMSLRIE